MNFGAIMRLATRRAVVISVAMNIEYVFDTLNHAWYCRANLSKQNFSQNLGPTLLISAYRDRQGPRMEELTFLD